MGAAVADKVTLFCAASTGDASQRAAEAYYKQTGIEVRLNPASSGTLAKQLVMGAQGDIYISASPVWMEYLEEEGLLQKWDVLARGKLVLIAPLDSSLEPFDLEEQRFLPGFDRFALGNPDHVPAGQYGKEALMSLHLWKTVTPHLLTGPDVRAVLRLVEMGEADLGIVYYSDALKSKKVKILSFFPSHSHSPIEYRLGLVKGASKEGLLFYQYLLSDPGQVPFKEAGL